MQIDNADENLLQENVEDHKLIVYQLFTRLFGNTNTTNKVYGTLAENGVGRFQDISPKALEELKKMGVTHVWYTGVIEHATMTDYTKYNIALDDADVIKGRAGSPYAIKDYYDINPDLANDVPNRMKEFEELVQRTHATGLKVIIDFVPNHVARSYRSDAKPSGVRDLGETDDTSKSFVASNNFYYLPGTSFVVPHDYKPLGDLPHPTKDGKFDETPAKVTGNDQFTHAPGINEWFETVKLNYGVDIQNNRTPHFEPIPDTWEKMREILQFWARKGVDGFRCDMAEMVPVEFWNWVIPKVKEVNKDIIFIAEIYNPSQYRNYLEQGKFSYLYDKVGLYDSLKAVMQNRAGANELPANWKQLQGINKYMLRFLENHDEQRIASEGFAGDARKGMPAMVVSATLNSGPVMVYFGQEVGEPGKGTEGFGGEDGRTTIFDYWGVPEHQKWINGGKFDGALLSNEQKKLRAFYSNLLNICTNHEAIRKGRLYDLQGANLQNSQYDAAKVYAYLRFTENQRVLIVVNFDAENSKEINLRIPANALAAMNISPEKAYRLTELLQNKQTISSNASEMGDSGIRLTLDPLGAYIFDLQEN
ncbi:alpha-amylase family glycosyl hydrolase [Rhodocytophaga aerolata]|uniref:Alpha-amylase family glycosyl hydrolase n=1 Tax=Rhodocytophaga aerolata TaxID=455078 RepID=A0ABT8R5R6_9BACT|nr:alpha-amylase family glycosyl hydrolase [Rhodocytophaga aerolata]MDO1446020.1 alpha-amylase family glycosyl hydrolase [Rhodocytophaga aerolata]